MGGATAEAGNSGSPEAACAAGVCAREDAQTRCKPRSFKGLESVLPPPLAARQPPSGSARIAAARVHSAARAASASTRACPQEEMSDGEQGQPPGLYGASPNG